MADAGFADPKRDRLLGRRRAKWRNRTKGVSVRGKRPSARSERFVAPGLASAVAARSIGRASLRGMSRRISTAPGNLTSARPRSPTYAGADTVVLQPTKDEPDLGEFIRFVAQDVRPLL